MNLQSKKSKFCCGWLFSLGNAISPVYYIQDTEHNGHPYPRAHRHVFGHYSALEFTHQFPTFSTVMVQLTQKFLSSAAFWYRSGWQSCDKCKLDTHCIFRGPTKLIVNVTENHLMQIFWMIKVNATFLNFNNTTQTKESDHTQTNQNLHHQTMKTIKDNLRIVQFQFRLPHQQKNKKESSASRAIYHPPPQHMIEFKQIR